VELPVVSCDAAQIQQVLINLVMNGAEATQTRGGGKVIVTTKLSEDRKSIALEVADNGDGISPENLSKIFDPFYTSKEEGKGVGLGLAVVYGIVEEHRGEIEAKSKLHEGTTFIVTLPIAGGEGLRPRDKQIENHKLA
jgi:two-component system NtrC family sensor kinase